MVKPEYRYLFYTTETCVQYVRAEHVVAKTDEMKMEIFTNNEVKWAHYKDEVREFTHANWARWKEEKPAWFKVETVPDQFIPAVELELLGSKRKRRGGAASSVVESLWEGEEAEQITKD